MAVTAAQILTEFKDLIQFVHGDTQASAEHIAPQTAPANNSIAFTTDPKAFEKALTRTNLILVTTPALAELAVTQKTRHTVLASHNVYLSMALVAQKFFEKKFLKMPFTNKNWHESAVIHPEAKVDPSAVLGPGAVIHSKAEVQARTVLHSNVVIESHSVIGSDCLIHSNVVIGHNVKMGSRCEVKAGSVIGSDGFGFAPDKKTGQHHKIPHYGELVIEDDVHIGALCAIDRGTFELSFIGSGTKIDNHCHFGHNIRIGKNCLITAGFRSAGTVTIGDNCVFGGSTCVNGKVEICSNVIIGPLSAVTNDITQPGTYSGYPPIEMKDFLKAQASFASLPRLRKNVAKILKHLGLSENEK